MGVWLLFSPGCSVSESAREPESFPKLPSGTWGLGFAQSTAAAGTQQRDLSRRNYRCCIFYEVLSSHGRLLVVPKFLSLYPALVLTLQPPTWLPCSRLHFPAPFAVDVVM